MPTSAWIFVSPIILWLIASVAVADELADSYGDQGVSEGELDGARGVDIDGEGNVFIADRFRNRILRFTMDGEFVEQSPSFFSGPPSVSFDQVTDVAIGADDRIYVANEDDAEIVVLDFDFNIIATFGGLCVAPELPGDGCSDPDGDGPLAVGDGQFLDVAAIAFDPAGRIVTADTGNDRIQVFDPDGTFLLNFGSEGSGNGEFQSPSGVDVGLDGTIYVADTGNDRVQVFQPDGTFIRAFGGSCTIETLDGCADPDGAGPLQTGDGQFNSVTDVIVDYGGGIYAVDSNNRRVQVFDADGGFLGKVSLPEDTARPRGIAIDNAARIHVTTGNASGTSSTVPFIVAVFGFDGDGDALPDLWERAGIDADLDGDVDLDLTDLGPDFRGVTMSADPARKDIFVEVDYLDCGIAGGDCAAGNTHVHRPRDDALELILQSFDDAPVADSIGINLWVQVDEALPHRDICDFDDGCFDAIKATNFGTEDERANPDTLAAKALAFRYNLWVHDKEPDNSSSGEAEGEAGLTGNDFIVSLGSWNGQVGGLDAQAGTFMHELGHTLGLGHGGGDNSNCKPNYLSVMSYTFAVTGLQPNGQFDLSRAALPTSGALVENDLDETVGIQDGAFTTFYGPLRDTDGDGNADDWVSAPGVGAIDWDFDGSAEGNPAMPTDINFLGIRGCGLDDEDVGMPAANPAATLTGFVDWDIIDLSFRDSPLFADGAHGETETEIDFETAQIVRERVWRAQLERLFDYSPKLICGIQRDPDELRLATGRYASMINIRNPSRRIVTFRKSLALAYPPAEQAPGERFDISLDTLRPGEALKVDCEDVRKTVFGGDLPDDYIDGFIVIETPERLDVVGVYSTATVGGVRTNDETPRHTDLEIERVPGRLIDLRPDPLADLVIGESFDFRADCQGSGAVQKCKIGIGFEVRNIGAAAAGPFNVRIVRALGEEPVEDLAINQSLAPGESIASSVAFEIAAPANDAAARRLCIRADAPENAVPELNEMNNERCVSF